MRLKSLIGATALTISLVTGFVTPGSAGMRDGTSYQDSPYQDSRGHPMQDGRPRPGAYRDAGQFWKDYQFYYDECRRPPTQASFALDYELVCYRGY